MTALETTVPNTTASDTEPLQFWNRVDGGTWSETFPPWRPTLEEQRILQGLMQRHGCHKAGRAALMGSTPELRNLAAGLALPLDVIDQSEAMYRAMSEACPDTRGERFYQDDWVRWFSGKPDQHYDLVCGDLVVRLLPDAVLAELARELGRCLAPGGRVVLRMHLRPNGVAGDPPLDSLMARFLALRLFDEYVVDRLFFALSDYCVAPDRHVDMAAMRRSVEQYVQSVGGSAPLLGLFADKWLATPLGFYSRTRAELDAAFAPALRVAHEYPTQYVVPETIHIVEWAHPSK